MNPEWIGFLAAILTTAAYVPQLIKVLRYRQTSGLSLGMYSLITMGIGFWFIYGVMIGSPSVMWANGITFIMATLILLMKIRHG
jgi:MtN3 and saliva related transmembrane protein